MEKQDYNNCPRCGHIYYDGDEGLCKWCIDEIETPDLCYVCGDIATCSSKNGQLCSHKGCHLYDDIKSQFI